MNKYYMSEIGGYNGFRPAIVIIATSLLTAKKKASRLRESKYTTLYLGTDINRNGFPGPVLCIKDKQGWHDMCMN